MEPRLSLITIGTTDLDRAVAFYRALGWEPHTASVPGEVAFYQLGGMAFAIWGRAELAADSVVDDGGGWGGITLAHNVRAAEDVDVLLDAAERAGARIGRPGAATEWGGYSGVFIDPDGHAWEIAHNPFWPLAPDGTVSLG